MLVVWRRWKKYARNPIINHITNTNFASLVPSHSGGFLWVQALFRSGLTCLTEMQCERNAYAGMILFILGRAGEMGQR